VNWSASTFILVGPGLLLIIDGSQDVRVLPVVKRSLECSTMERFVPVMGKGKSPWCMGHRNKSSAIEVSWKQE